MAIPGISKARFEKLKPYVKVTPPASKKPSKSAASKKPSKPAPTLTSAPSTDPEGDPPN